MKPLTKLTLIILILLFGGTVVYILSLNNAIHSLEVSTFQVKEIDYQSQKGVKFELVLNVTNPSRFDLFFDRLTYEITLENEELASGDIQGRTISSQSTTALPLILETKWAPNHEELLHLLPNGVPLRIRGNIHLTLLEQEIVIPFEEEHNILEYILAIMQTQSDNFVGSFTNPFGAFTG